LYYALGICKSTLVNRTLPFVAPSIILRLSQPLFCRTNAAPQSTTPSIPSHLDARALAVTMSGNTLNFVTFNQDHSCLAVATTKGFRIYHTDPFNKIFNSDEGNVTIIEMLFSTSLVALVRSPRHLVIQNTKAS